MQRLYISRARGGKTRATMKRADAEAVQIKGPQRKETGGNNESRCTGYTDQWVA